MPDATIPESGTFSRDALKEFLLAGLRDAHAMEQEALSLTKGAGDRLESYPELQVRFRQHYKETEGQRDRLHSCLEALGSDESMLKDMAMTLHANMQAWMNAAASDEVVKTILTGTAFEHFEIASYRSLLAAAELYAEPQIIGAIRENLQEEEAMAEFLEEQLAPTTHAYLSRASRDMPAKR